MRRSRPYQVIDTGGIERSRRPSWVSAADHRVYVCGFQVQVIGSHLSAHIVDAGGSAEMGAITLMLVAFFNMIGSYACGRIGERYRKKYALSILYTFRSMLNLGFVILPL
tara:strand:+ start:248 stop:577 length:330 start_codon:yes stop_codon:yes gene_type:complete